MSNKIKCIKNFDIDWEKNIASYLLCDEEKEKFKENMIREKDNYNFKLKLGKFFVMLIFDKIKSEKGSKLNEATKFVKNKLKDIYEWVWVDPCDPKYKEYGRSFLEVYHDDYKRKKVYIDSFNLEVCLYYYLFFKNKISNANIKNFFDMKYPKSKRVMIAKEDRNINCYHSEKDFCDPKDYIFYVKNDKIVKFKKGFNVCGNFKDGVIVAQNLKRKGANTGLIDIKENIILPLEYYDIFPFNMHVGGNLALVTSENAKTGLINSDGKFILPCIFEDIGQSKKGQVVVKFNGIEKMINLKIY